MNTYKVMKAVEELICSQEDSDNMVLPITIAMESNYDYDTIWIELVDGAKFSIHIFRLKTRPEFKEKEITMKYFTEVKTEEELRKRYKKLLRKYHPDNENGSTEIKTLDRWCEFTDRTGKESIYDYLTVEDIVSQDIVDNFMDMLPPRATSHGYLQVGEAYNHVYDLDKRLKLIYMTFAKCDSQRRYHGNYFTWETIDIIWR